MKIKKAVPIILSALMVGGMFVGCTETPDGEHEKHDYVYTKIDESNHKKTCKGCDEVNETEAHAYDDEADTECNYCGYVRELGGNDGNDGDDKTPDNSTKFNGKIYLVGDSTVCGFSDEYYIPRYGYGTQIYNYVNMTAGNVKNLALSGRSSWSFLSESNYSTLTSGISSGDYLFIGFGHNDEKREVARYTDPTLASDNTTTTIGTYDAERTVSFKYVLKHYYVDVAKAAGATPVLCTPITRLFEDSKKSSYDSVHVTTTTTVEDPTAKVTTTWNGGDYAQAIRELAEEENLLCVDLTTITKTEYKQAGYDEAVKYHAATGAKWTDDTKTEKEATGVDGTHTNLYGAKMNAYHIANAVKESSLSLAASIKTNIAKPTYEENINEAINQGYTVPESKPFNPATDASSKWSAVNGTELNDTNSDTVYKWYGTAFGANLGTSNIAGSSAFTIAKGNDADGVTFTVHADSGKGKIQSGDDSIVAVFIQVPFKTAFTVTATATVTSFGGNQSGFGLMVRDDITIDKNLETKGNYVTAGCYGNNSGASAIMCFARNGGSLTNSLNSTNPPTAGDVFNLSLARTSQSITANMNTYGYNAVSDFDLAVSDSEYVYVCLWATRGAEVTFSNITFTSNEWVSA